MKNNYQKAFLLIFLLVGTAMIFTERYVEMSMLTYITVGIVLTYMIRMGEVLDKRMSVTFGFFALLHWMRPANDYIANLLGANVDGTYFIFPILIFTALLIALPSLRKDVDWWKVDLLSNQILVQAGVAIVLGCGVMMLYIHFNQESLARFIDMLPTGGLLKIVLLGVAFALLNAVVEEYIIRGMVWNGLAKTFSKPQLITLIQAALFGLSHYWGLPGGLMGVLMVFIWSLAMGYFRIKTGGLIIVIVAHFALNLFQYFVLYAYK